MIRVGADGWDSEFRTRLYDVLIASEADPEASMPSPEFLASLHNLLAGLHLLEAVRLPDSDLLLARAALAYTMPHFFSDPSRTLNLRPAERLYLLHLIWENGTLGRETETAPIRPGSTSVIFSNNRRSEYLGLRDKILSRMTDADLQNAINHLCNLLAGPAKLDKQPTEN